MLSESIKDSTTGELADSERNASIINKYFASIGRVLNEKLPLVPNPLPPIIHGSNFDCLPTISVAMVEELVGDIDI